MTFAENILIIEYLIGAISIWAALHPPSPNGALVTRDGAKESLTDYEDYESLGKDIKGSRVNKHTLFIPLSVFFASGAHKDRSIAPRGLGCELFSESFSLALSELIKRSTVTIPVQELGRMRARQA